MEFLGINNTYKEIIVATVKLIKLDLPLFEIFLHEPPAADEDVVLGDLVLALLGRSSRLLIAVLTTTGELVWDIVVVT